MDERVRVQNSDRRPKSPKFELLAFSAITTNLNGQWLIKRLVPRTGTGIMFGPSQSFKSFVATDLGLHVALGWQWGGRRVAQAPVVYIASEGASGIRKRKVGFEITHPTVPANAPFFLISKAPAFGVGRDDLDEMIRSIEGARVKPGLIIVDTLSKSLGGGDENGAGMVQFLANMEALAAHFQGFALGVHHTGLGDNTRERGHSSAQGATDVRILCTRREREMSTMLTIEKLKDDEAGGSIRANLERTVIGQDEDGDEVSTLVVASIDDDAAPPIRAPAPQSVPRQQRLLMDVIAEAISDAGEAFAPFGREGSMVRAVDDAIVRQRYYARIAEQPRPGDDPKKLAERQRQAFNSAIKGNIATKRICAGAKSGTRMLWLP